jgi:phospholipid/cholesterol/gamma-HCH transport system substrate-binding protein
MTRRHGTASLVASPVLVGAVTVLIAIIAVFIAYNANRGLPFVPTYDLEAELPSGGKLVKGNEVRTGGFRVGVVQDITPKTIVERGRRRSVAVVKLKLDKAVEPLGVDSKLRVRPRSALGLKYVELTPGRSKDTYKPGDTIPLRNSSEPLDLEDVFTTFQPKTRDDIRTATEGFGDAFTGRGQSINTAIGALNPFFKSLTPVMRTLADPDTQLDQFFLQLGRSAAQVAPVARTNALLFTKMADTFAAITRSPAGLQATIEKSPPTEDVAISSFRAQRPFLADFADLSRRLRPAVRQLPVSLPLINRALKVGTPVLPRTVGLNRDLRDLSRELLERFEDPSTLLALQDLNTALTVTRPAVEYIAPFQTVCNYFVYFLHPLGEHRSQLSPDKSGTVQNQGLKFVNNEQPNSYGTIKSSRNVDIMPGQKARGAKFMGQPAHRLIAPLYPPAIDAQGNADCETGQQGYPNGPFTTGGRYGRGALSDGTPAGGNASVTDPDYPILSGGTFKARELGINNLRDVP